MSTVADYPREFPDGKSGKDDWGVLWLKGEEGPHPAEKDFIITDLEKWRDQIVFPDLDTYDWTASINQAKAVDRDHYFVQGVSDYGCFDRP
jgi:hypothetical protein